MKVGGNPANDAASDGEHRCEARAASLSPIIAAQPNRLFSAVQPIWPATGLKKGQRVRHAKYGEGTILMREGNGEDANLTVLFVRHGMKKLMEKFANLQMM